MVIDDEMRWLLAIISNTGMRLSEAAGLHRDDIILDAPIPYISLQPHWWRRLKTKGSATRHVPLIGASLREARRIQQYDSSYVFPRYCDSKICNAHSASAALNKWMKPTLKDDAVVHTFRHSMRDRLRAVECLVRHHLPDRRVVFIFGRGIPMAKAMNYPCWPNGWRYGRISKESPFDGGSVKGAALSTEKQDISFGGSYLALFFCPKNTVHHRVINL